MASLPGIIIKIGADTKDAVDGLNRVNSAIGQATTPTQRLGTAVAAVGGALVAAFSVERVISFLQESAAAAMEDEKSMVALAKAMENVGLAQKNAAAEDLIKAMSLQFGIADDQLRPAFQRLVTATRDVEKSQRLLQTAMDISQAGYTDLESAAKALSAASMGNFTALQRLKLPLDANTIAAKDFDGAIAQLNQTVGGQAAAAAETYQGKLNRVTVAANEAKETIGYALLQAFDDLSQTVGGPNGVVRNITDAGDAVAGLITFVSRAIQPITQMASSLKLIDGSTSGFDSLLNFFVRLGQYIPGAGSLLNLLAIAIKKGEEWSNDAATAQRNMTSATVAAASAAGQAVAPITDLGDGLDDLAMKAYTAAGSYLSLYEAIANQRRVARDLANTSGTITSAIAQGVEQGYDLTDAKLKEIRERLERGTRRQSSGAGGGSKAAEEFVLLDGAMRRTLQSVNRTATSYDDLTRKLGGDDIAAFSRKMLAAGKITGDTKDEFESMVGTIRDRLNTALGDARRELDEWRQKYSDLLRTVQSGVSQGNGIGDAAQAQADAAQMLADAQRAYDEALAGGNADEITRTESALSKAKGQQGTLLTFLQKGVNAAESFSDQIQQLIRANASLEVVQQIVQLGAKTGSRVAAELLAGGAEAINQANRMVTAVGNAALAAGTLAANTFYGAGVASAQAYVDALSTSVQPLLQGLLNSIAAQISAALRQPVNASLSSGPAAPTTAQPTTARPLGAYTPTSPTSGPNIPSGEGRIYAELRALSRRAVGGPVMAGTPYIVGEVGPELFVPGTSGSIVPNSALGGNTYNITVQAGIGDPRAIGQQVVEAITRFEKVNGPVYAKAG